MHPPAAASCLPPMAALPLVEDVEKGFAIEGQTHGPAQSPDWSKGGAVGLTSIVRGTLPVPTSHNACGGLRLEVLERRDGHTQTEIISNRPSEEGQVCGVRLRA